MAETLGLFAIVVALYLAECLAVVPRDAVLFVRGRRRHAARPAARALGTRTHAIVLLDPLPFAAEALVCQPWPVAVSASGLGRREAPDETGGTAGAPGGDAGGPAATAAIARARIEDRALRVAGAAGPDAAGAGSAAGRGSAARAGSVAVARSASDAAWFRWASGAAAARFAGWLASLAGAAPRARDAAIEQELARRMSVPAIEARLAEARRVARPARVTGSALFLVVFAAFPALYATGYLGAWWPWGALAGLALHGLTVQAQLRAARALHGLRGAERWLEGIKASASPLGSMRAGEHLVRHALDGYEPAAVALAVADAEGFEAVARASLDRVRASSHESVPHGEFAAAYDAAMGRLMRRAGLRPGHLAMPPAPMDDAAQSYCPRCRAEYAIAAGTCSHCGDVALVPLDRRAAEARREVLERVERRRARPR
jgi:hypothetical protein